ncbi:Asp23/Gls24 family envelope stress response protein [Pseudonocardia xinjiangensis]|uniref:Asp23/Gls24 family envelope stress response protein n=1 Tax=Pseudonocardia xinjiangensis TaxID=75289 RepID=UPI003D90A330
MAVNGGSSADGPDDSVPRLGCGRDAALAWDRAAAGTAPDEHERDCPHCGAAFADARGLDAVVHRMASEELEPPPSTMDRVMAAVLTELRPHDLLTLPSPHGPVRLSRPAAAAVLRHVVDRMDGLRARSCRIEQLGEAGAQAHAADVTISVTARFGIDLMSVTARVRQMVIAAGEQALGVPVRRVDIDVVDLFGADLPGAGLFGEERP